MNKIENVANNKRQASGFYGFNEPREYAVGFIPHKSGTYRIEIDAAIEDVAQFSTAIQVLNMAKEEDEVEIHLQCPGGNVDASGAFLHAMMKCEAPIHVVASGGCHSAATHILLGADSFELAENFNSLVHNGSAGAYGNINEYHSKSDFDKEFIRKQYESIYEGFLTPQEFSDMMRGDNIWLDATAWCERTVKRGEYFQAKYEAQQAEEQAALLASQEPSTKPRPQKRPLSIGKQKALQGPQGDVE